MSKRSLFFSLLGATALFIGAYSCTKDKTPFVDTECDPERVYFTNDIYPIIASNCAKSGCHDAATHAEGRDYTTYAGIMEDVRAGKPNNSELYKVLVTDEEDERMPPPGNTPLTQDQINLIFKWIDQGAYNSTCVANTPCDTTAATFAAKVLPILDTNCKGCHSGIEPADGIDLSTYATVIQQVPNGKLLNSILQNGNAVAMPPTGKLSNCDIQTIERWINDGYPNN